MERAKLLREGGNVALRDEGEEELTPQDENMLIPAALGFLMASGRVFMSGTTNLAAPIAEYGAAAWERVEPRMREVVYRSQDALAQRGINLNTISARGVHGSGAAAAGGGSLSREEIRARVPLYRTDEDIAREEATAAGGGVSVPAIGGAIKEALGSGLEAVAGFAERVLPLPEGVRNRLPHRAHTE